MEITTDKGFTCTINEDALGDWEITEKLIDVQKGEINYLPEVLSDLIGEDGYKAAKDFVRNDKGRVPTEELMALFSEILTAASKSKTAKKK